MRKNLKEEVIEDFRSMLEDIRLDVEVHKYRGASRRLADFVVTVPISEIPELALVQSIISECISDMNRIYESGIATAKELKNVHQAFMEGFDVVLKGLQIEVDKALLLSGLNKIAPHVKRTRYRLLSEGRDLQRIIRDRREMLEKLMPKREP